MNKDINPLHIIIILLSAGILFLPYLGNVHLFDWDEINFAESAREMILSGDYTRVTINYQPFWEKPPLFIWMQVLSMKLFGINEFAARFPNAVFGALTLILIYTKGRTYFKGHLAHWWVLCYVGAITPHFYFKTGLIDPAFNYFIFLSVLQFYSALSNHSNSYNANRHFLLAGLYTGIAILIKGPAALLICILVLFSMVFAKRMVWFFNVYNLFIYLFIAACVSCIWFLPETIKNGPHFIIQFVQYQIELFSQNVAGHQQPFWYHPLVLLIGCFPISLIAIGTWKRNEFYTYPENVFRLTMMCLFWVVLILFSIVKTKIVHYSSMCWLPLTFMAAYGIESINQGVFRLKGIHKLALSFTGLLIASACIAFPLIMIYNKQWLIALIPDTFSKENMMAAVQWNLSDLIPGVILLIVVLIFITMWKSENHVLKYGILLFGNTLCISLLSYSFTPKIEQHTQAAAIRFFKSLNGTDCYIFNAGYKSYAPYFYAGRKPMRYTDKLNLLNEAFLRQKHKQSYLELSESEKSELDDLQKDWLLKGDIDKDVYFIAKSNDTEGIENSAELVMLKNENGFVMFKRKR